MGIKLIICEKPSVARSISSVVGASRKRDGYFEGNGCLVSYCIGHLVELAPPGAYDEKYDKWSYADLPIIPPKWKYVASPGKAKQLDILNSLMNRLDVGTVINACDAGREGQHIFQLVCNFCGCKKPVQRLWISSLEDTAIRAGLDNLRPGTDYDRLYESALCRSQADWIVGINATRLFSVLYGGGALNVGRVQSPSLSMIVERAQAIADFKKEKFYTVELKCNGFSASSGRTPDKDAAQAIQDACNGGEATVMFVGETEKNIQPPKLFDLTSLQREANRVFGYTAQQTLDCAQALYEKTLCSYPRTDSKYITHDMQGSIPGLVDAVCAAMPMFSDLDMPVNTGKIVDNSGVSDHHAILPTGQIATANLDALPTAERNILTMIAARLLCAVGEKHVYSETNITLESAGTEFNAKGKTVISDGWKAVQSAFMASLKEKSKVEQHESAATLPEPSEGQTLRKVVADIKEGETSPPKPYTEDSLLAAMESAGDGDAPEDAQRKGIGTPATRAGIIEKLIKSGFMERQKKSLVPTEKGYYLIAILPDILKSPALTAQWEHGLGQVERGELDAGIFMDGITDMTRALVAEHNAPNPKYLTLFAPAPQGGEAIGVCPRCGGGVRESGKGFFCDNGACGFKLWKASRFWTTKKKPLTANIVAALLKDGNIPLKGLYSEKTGKLYSATVILDDTGGEFVGFKMKFDGGVKGGKS